MILTTHQNRKSHELRHISAEKYHFAALYIYQVYGTFCSNRQTMRRVLTMKNFLTRYLAFILCDHLRQKNLRNAKNELELRLISVPPARVVTEIRHILQIHAVWIDYEVKKGCDSIQTT